VRDGLIIMALGLGACQIGCRPSSPASELVSATCPDEGDDAGRGCAPAPTPRVQFDPSAPANDEPTQGEREAETGSPRFLDLDLDPQDAYPLRAKVRRSGPLYESRNGPVLDHGDGHEVVWQGVAIDADRDGSPRRPRLLCEGRRHRVALHRDAEDLAPVALAGALMVPARIQRREATKTTPGVRLEAGAIVELVPAMDRPGLLRVTYDGLFLEAAGWVASDRVDVVYEPQPLVDDRLRNGELVANVELWASPTGGVMATIEVAPTIAIRRYVQTLGPPRHGRVLVRYYESQAQAVGWVPTSAVTSFPLHRIADGGGGGGTGTDGWPLVELSKGTLLASDGSGAVLGIVTHDGPFWCDADCNGPRPLTLVSACAGRVKLRAKRSGDASSPADELR